MVVATGLLALSSMVTTLGIVLDGDHSFGEGSHTQRVVVARGQLALSSMMTTLLVSILTFLRERRAAVLATELESALARLSLQRLW